jgi:co-chaperonin GroES (HSP10)
MPKRALATAHAIKNTQRHRIDSDDWATKKDVQAQLDQLHEYLVGRREEEEDYNLPMAVGWKLMVLMITIPEKSAGGVIVVDDAREQRSLASPQGLVLDIGPQAFNDPSRFAAPWVEVGDRITITKYDATMFQLGNGQRLGFLNDTQPVSIIDRGWEIPQ